MELYFDFPTIETPTGERNEFLIETSFNIGSSNNIDFITVATPYTSEESNSVDFTFIARSEYNKYDCYQDFKSKLKIIKDGMEEELVKINSVYIDLENLSIDEFENKYFNMIESTEDELAQENFNKLDNITFESEDLNVNKYGNLFDKLTSSTDEQLLDLWKNSDTEAYGCSIPVDEYRYYLSEELAYRSITISE